MRIASSKKGDTGSNVIIWIVRLSFAIIVMVTAALFIDAMVVKNVDIRDVEAHVFANRILYSQHGASAVESGRVLVGEIDEGNLERGFEDTTDFYEEGYLAAKMNYGCEEEPKEFFYNKEWYEKYQPKSDMKGEGGVHRTIITKIVLVDGVLKKMMFEVLMPNE